MRKRRGVRGLVVAIVNVGVILAAALIIKSQAAVDPAPDYASFDLPSDSEFTPPAPIETRRVAAPRYAAPAATAPPSLAGGQDTSATVVPPVGRESEDSSAVRFEQLGDLPSRSGYALLGAAVTDSSPANTAASASGYGSPGSAPTSGRRYSSGGNYAGGSGSSSGGGGGSGSGGGGGGGSRSSAKSTSADSGERSGQELISLADYQGASFGDAPSFLPTGSPGNPGLGAGTSFSFPLPGRGTAPGGSPISLTQPPGGGSSSGAIGTGAALPSVGGGTGSTAGGTQLQEPVQVPEPSTILLLGGGLALAAYRRRRRPTR